MLIGRQTLCAERDYVVARFHKFSNVDVGIRFKTLADQLSVYDYGGHITGTFRSFCVQPVRSLYRRIEKRHPGNVSQRFGIFLQMELRLRSQKIAAEKHADEKQKHNLYLLQYATTSGFGYSCGSWIGRS